MPNADFKVRIETSEDQAGLKIKVDKNETHLHFDNFGVDQISFEFSANPGQPLRPISKVASGGEMSRIMLAIELVFQKAEQVKP